MGLCSGGGNRKVQRLHWGWHMPACLATRCQACRDTRGRSPMTGFAQGWRKPRVTAGVQLGGQQCCFCWQGRQLPGHTSSFSLLLSSQILLTFTKSSRAAVCERAVGRIGMLSRLLANYSSLEVRSQAPCSQAVSPSLHTGATHSSGLPARALGKALL